MCAPCCAVSKGARSQCPASSASTAVRGWHTRGAYVWRSHARLSAVLLRYVRKLFEQFVAAGAVDDDAAEASRQVESQRAYVVDQLLALVRNRRVPRDAVWTLACAQFLFFHAYFEGKVRLQLSNPIPAVLRCTPKTPPAQSACVCSVSPTPYAHPHPGCIALGCSHPPHSSASRARSRCR